MGNTVAHQINIFPRYLWVCRSEIPVITIDIPGSFPDNFDVADDSILHQFVFQKCQLVNIFGIDSDLLDGLENVAKIFRDAQGILTHTDSASDKTRFLKLSGNALGVSTSTVTPRSFCSRF